MRNSQKPQRGFTLIEMTVVIFLSTLLALLATPAIVRYTEESGMVSTGVYMSVMKGALESYNLHNHEALANSLPVVGFVTPLAPTIPELIAAKYIASPGFPTITPQRQQVRTTVSLANCPGPNCKIFSTAYTTTPLLYTGTVEPRYDLVAAYLASPGAAGAGAASQLGAEGVLRSANFSVPNPVAGTPGGIIAIGTYLDDGIYANFVRVQDTRDPNLLGKLTVAGDITGKANVGTSDGVAACLRAALTNTGDVLANSTTCIKRAWLDGTNGQAGVANAAGATKVLLDGTTGDVSSFDATGRNAAGVRYDAFGKSVVYSDSLQNTTGSAKLFENGVVEGVRGNFQTVTINNSAVAGAACPVPNDVVRSTVGVTPILLICSGGIWRSSTGTEVAASLTACVVDGAPGLTPGGVSQICVGGFWIPTKERFGRFAATDNYANVRHGDVIAKPVCSPGGIPKIYFTPQGLVNAEFVVSPLITQYVSNFRVDELASPGNYTAIVDDTVGFGALSGNPLPGYALAVTGCFY